MTRRARLAAALLIPVLGVGLLIVRGELRTAGPRVWHVDIAGYDPRDLLSGRYLRFRYRWTEEAEPPCPADDAACCLCLAGADPQGPSRPRVSAARCDDPGPCQDLVRPGLVSGPQRFYLDERFAAAAEQALRDGTRRPQIALVVTEDGGVAVLDLLLDGLPWRDALAP